MLYDNRFNRSVLYRATPELPSLSFEKFISHEKFMIELRSKFLKTEDTSYLLKLLASVVDENKVKSSDNGLTQKVEIQQGITTVGEMAIKPIVKLKPYRTFLEVDQPESEFLVRLQEGGNIALYEADGGMWKLQAKNNIAAYFKKELERLIRAERIVVIG